MVRITAGRNGVTLHIMVRYSGFQCGAFGSKIVDECLGDACCEDLWVFTVEERQPGRFLPIEFPPGMSPENGDAAAEKARACSRVLGWGRIVFGIFMQVCYQKLKWRRPESPSMCQRFSQRFPGESILQVVATRTWPYPWSH